MVANYPTYEQLMSCIPSKERGELQQLYEKYKEIGEEEIKRNIEDDKNHLQIVNFCINPFYYNSVLHKKTGYLFIRVEPFYRLQLKDFDVAIYNKDRKSLLLVECKSSVRNANEEVDNILKKIDVSEKNNELLEEILGSEITTKEYVLCSSSSVIHKFKPVVQSKDVQLCLWSADTFKKTLFLEKLRGDTESEIKSGRLHKDSQLRRLLLNGVTSPMGSVPTVAFLPSSHPCTTLRTVGSFIFLHMERTGSERFRLLDIQKILEQERALSNFDPSEIAALANRVLTLGMEINIFEDKTPSVNNLDKKEFALTRASIKGISNAVDTNYVELTAGKKAREKAVEEFFRGKPTINQFIEQQK